MFWINQKRTFQLVQIRTFNQLLQQKVLQNKKHNTMDSVNMKKLAIGVALLGVATCQLQREVDVRGQFKSDQRLVNDRRQDDNRINQNYQNQPLTCKDCKVNIQPVRDSRVLPPTQIGNLGGSKGRLDTIYPSYPRNDGSIERITRGDQRNNRSMERDSRRDQRGDQINDRPPRRYQINDRPIERNPRRYQRIDIPVVINSRRDSPIRVIRDDNFGPDIDLRNQRNDHIQGNNGLLIDPRRDQLKKFIRNDNIDFRNQQYDHIQFNNGLRQKNDPKFDRETFRPIRHNGYHNRGYGKWAEGIQRLDDRIENEINGNFRNDVVPLNLRSRV